MGLLVGVAVSQVFEAAKQEMYMQLGSLVWRQQAAAGQGSFESIEPAVMAEG